MLNLNLGDWLKADYRTTTGHLAITKKRPHIKETRSTEALNRPYQYRDTKKWLPSLAQYGYGS
jgi:hypothetical protein